MVAGESAHFRASPADPGVNNVLMDFPDLPQRKAVVDSWLGKRRPLSDLSRLEVAFLIVGTLSLLACIGLTIERLDYLSPAKCPHNGSQDAVSGIWAPSMKNITLEAQNKKCGAEFTFALLILINCVFCIYHVVHGVVWERAYELYIFAGSILLVSAYCVIDFAVGVDDGLYGFPYKIKLARLVILLVLGIADVVLGCWIAAKFLREGRFACNVVQCYDERIQRECKFHFFTQSLLTFDLEFQVTMLILILKNGFEFHLSHLEMGILIGGLIFAVIWVSTAGLSLRFENRPMAWLVLATSVLEPAYIVYKFYDSADILTTSTDETSRALQYCVFLGGSLGIVLRVVLVIFFCLNYRSYQNGDNLSNKIYGPPPFKIFSHDDHNMNLHG